MAHGPAIVGLTGGIGSGKSALASALQQLGVPVFYADQEAKAFYLFPENRTWIAHTFGEQSFFPNGELNRAHIAQHIFSSKELKALLEAKIHPFVQGRFQAWMQQQTAPYILREAAILIESGSYTDCAAVVVVEAPLEQRIQRVMERDAVPREVVLQRIQAQMSDEQRSRYATLRLQNPDGTDVQALAKHLHQTLLERLRPL